MDQPDPVRSDGTVDWEQMFGNQIAHAETVLEEAKNALKAEEAKWKNKSLLVPSRTYGEIGSLTSFLALGPPGASHENARNTQHEKMTVVSRVPL